MDYSSGDTRLSKGSILECTQEAPEKTQLSSSSRRPPGLSAGRRCPSCTPGRPGGPAPPSRLGGRPFSAGCQTVASAKRAFHRSQFSHAVPRAHRVHSCCPFYAACSQVLPVALRLLVASRTSLAVGAPGGGNGRPGGGTAPPFPPSPPPSLTPPSLSLHSGRATV